MSATREIVGPVAEDRVAERLRGFGPVGVVATIVVPFAITPWVGAVLALVWARWSQTPLREMGYRRPRSWLWSTMAGVTLGFALKLVMKSLIMPLLGADPVNQAYHYLAGNAAALPGMIFAVTIGAGFGEETVYRGFLFARFRRLFGAGTAATIAIVLVTSACFSLAHYPIQGLAGAEQAALTGLIFGAIVARTGGIWLSMVAHAAFDLTAVAMIYRGLESEVAHFFFKSP